MKHYYKKGSNQFIRKHKGLKKEAINSLIKVSFTCIAIIALMQWFKLSQRIQFYQWRDSNVIAPCANFCAFTGKVEAQEPIPLTIDQMVDKYSKKYGKTTYSQNRLKALTHYLLLREQNYGGSDACGDSGLACGPMQFHAGTYTANRQRMIDKKLVDHMGSRLDMEDSIETAIWMFSIGQENQWGPYYRGEIKL
jgi:hypothetical protein